MTKKRGRLLPDSAVCERYGRHPSTIYNWDRDPALNFPGPIWIKGRKYRDENELDEFDRAQATKRETTT